MLQLFSLLDTFAEIALTITTIYGSFNFTDRGRNIIAEISASHQGGVSRTFEPSSLYSKCLPDCEH